MPPDANRSSDDGNEIIEVTGEPGTPSGTMRLADFIPIDIYIPSVERGALSKSRRKRRFLDFLRAHPSKDWFLRSTFVGRLRRRGHQSSPGGADNEDSDSGGCRRRRFRVPFVRKIKWGKLWSYAVSWCKKPENFAMIIWLAFVAAGLLLLLMLMTGMLDEAIPDDERRKKWTEVINQILNALFTIMCLYQHPKIFHHLVLLLRWRPGPGGDREEARKVYCKDGAARPHDRSHMLVVVLLLHVTCFAQYYCCALFWSYTRKDRPDWALNIGYGLGTGCPVIAGLYTAYSPLGRKKADEPDTESSSSSSDAARERGGRAENDGVGGQDVEIKVYNRRVVVSSPEWSGGLFDCCDDGTVCALSATCTFCVFGWNMERLGFGNMYVHAFTFILLLVAPFLIFSVTALNIHDEDIRDTVVSAGVFLSLCGFLYGGFWRSQMRKRYKLPGGGFFSWCGSAGAAVNDCAKWLFCWSCALAQEVRTANFYDVEDDRFVAVMGARNREGRPVLVPLPREASTTTHVRSMSCPSKLDDAVNGGAGVTSPIGVEMAAMERSATYHPMRPPVPPLIEMDGPSRGIGL
jgi:Cys-rich protein (TIGR01571 family)